MILRLFRWLAAVVAVLIGLVALYVGVALALGSVPVNKDFEPSADGVEIAVCSNGVHTDFVLPVKTADMDWMSQFAPKDFGVPVGGFDHIGIGWGDLDFYRSTPAWNDFRASTALKAVAGLGPAALHVQYRPGPGAVEDCRRLRVDLPHYRALTNAIIGARIPGEAVPGYGASDAFYPAEGHFSLFKSCNVWVGERLKESGLPTGLWTPFAFQVLSHL